MPTKLLHFEYAYEFADRIVKALSKHSESEDILIDFLDNDSGDFINRASKPQKWTLLHVFIQNVNFSDFEWLTGHFIEESVPEILDFLERADVPIPSWLSNHNLQPHIRDLDKILETACRKFTEATFTLLFGDKKLLLQFQQLIAMRLREVKKSTQPDLLRKDGVLKRPHYIPVWLKTAVFHRDKGRCQICRRDLTGVIDIVNDLCLDHIWPLARSGSNDPTNFQLLCESCNRIKSSDSGNRLFKSFTYW